MNFELHLQEIKLKNLPIMISGSDLRLSFVTKIITIEKNKLILLNTIPPEYISKFVNSDQHHLTTDSYRIKADRIGSDGVNIILDYSEAEETAGTRSEERITIGTQKAWCEFLNPMDNETVLHKKLIDFSKTGFSLVTVWDSLLFQPHIEIPNITIHIDGTVRKVDGRIVYKRQFVNFDGRIRQQIGFRVINKE